MSKNPSDIAKEEAAKKAERMALMKEKAAKIHQAKADALHAGEQKRFYNGEVLRLTELQHRQIMGAVDQLDAKAGITTGKGQIR